MRDASAPGGRGKPSRLAFAALGPLLGAPRPAAVCARSPARVAGPCMLAGKGFGKNDDSGAGGKKLSAFAKAKLENPTKYPEVRRPRAAPDRLCREPRLWRRLAHCARRGLADGDSIHVQ
jgi:hypothetical protein